MRDRKVTRVLVMLEYGPGDPDTGEVFDLTELAEEMRSKSQTLGHGYNATINLHVRSQKTFGQDQPPFELTLNWSSYAGGEFSAKSGHLDDAINAGLPDGERVQRIKKTIKRLRKKADGLEYDASLAKLEQVAAIRHLHPIARVTEAPIAALENHP